jgi:hypothetical protein
MVTAVPPRLPIQRCVLDRTWNTLWRWSGVRDRSQADGGEGQRATDCGPANDFLYDHADPLCYVTFSRVKASPTHKKSLVNLYVSSL